MASLGKIICMGYFKQDGSQYICPIDMGYSDKSGGKVTHSICPSCMAEMLKSQ
jgi:hypothetical protein